jgi:hypothetical protein
MIESFYNTSIYWEGNSSNPHIYLVTPDSFDIQLITQALANNKLLLYRGMSVDSASEIFGELVDFYDLRESYDIQMQLIVYMMKGRESVDEVAVTVNERGPFEIIQPHSEGDSSSPLDLFGLHCSKNAEIGGENILSLINQDADHTSLLAKEKVIV